MKHNKNDIIKAIEYHKINNCCKCPYEGLPDCIGVLCDSTIEFIKEITEECERLTLENAGFEAGVKAGIKVLRANTVREMQAEIINRCIKGGIYPAFVASTIDKIAKEMIGENENLQ